MQPAGHPCAPPSLTECVPQWLHRRAPPLSSPAARGPAHPGGPGAWGPHPPAGQSAGPGDRRRAEARCVRAGVKSGLCMPWTQSKVTVPLFPNRTATLTAYMWFTCLPSACVHTSTGLPSPPSHPPTHPPTWSFFLDSLASTAALKARMRCTASTRCSGGRPRTCQHHMCASHA
jgi:hypothetical protein